MRDLGPRRRVVGALSAALLSGGLVACATSGTGSVRVGGDGDLRAPSLSLPATPIPAAVGATSPASPTAVPSTTPRTTPLGSPAAHPATVAPQEVVAPTRLLIPRIGLSMPVDPESVAGDGQMGLPTSAFVAGWYRFGPAPGDAAGASVIAGHIDTAAEGVGPMAGLAGLRTGDVVQVMSGSVRHDYRVQSVEEVHKTSLDLAALFTRSGAPVLHLVTCGGRYDRVARHYEDNIIVIATPVS